jgi:hypothetical protein
MVYWNSINLFHKSNIVLSNLLNITLTNGRVILDFYDNITANLALGLQDQISTINGSKLYTSYRYK